MIIIETGHGRVVVPVGAAGRMVAVPVDKVVVETGGGLVVGRGSALVKQGAGEVIVQGSGGRMVVSGGNVGDVLVWQADGTVAWQKPTALALPDGFAIWHRHAGVLAEDDALSAVDVFKRYPGAAAVVDGGDHRLLVDNATAVSMHDTTTARTCTSTVTVATTDAATWATLRLRARTPAIPINEAPPTSAQLFDKMQTEGLIFAPEQKLTANATLATALTGLITARGLQAQAIVGSVSLADLATPAASGIPTMYIADNAPDTQANILAAAPNFFAYNFNRPSSAVPDSLLTALAAAGIRIGVWTVDTREDLRVARTRLDALGITLNHFYSNDPAWVNAVNVLEPRTTDPFSAGQFVPGMVAGQPFQAADNQTKDTRGTFVGSAGAYRLALNDPDLPQSMLQGWAAPARSSSSSISVDLTFDALGSSSLRWPGVWFNCPTDRLVYNGPTAATNRGQGYMVLLRVNGSLELFRENGDGLSPTSLGTVATTALSAGQTATVKIEPNVPGGQIRVTRTDSGGFTPITATDSTFRGDYMHFAKFVAATEAMLVSFSNVVITQ